MHQARGAGKRKSPKRSSLLTFVLIGGAGTRRTQRFIGLIVLSRSPSSSQSSFLSALSASPHLCARSPPTRATAIKYFGTFHTMGEKLVFDDIDASIARQRA